MSKKHFDEYYLKVCKQYGELLENLKEFEQMAMQEIVSPERVEKYKETLQPIKNNYMTLSYVKFLLDMPEREHKQKRYSDSLKKRLKGLDIKRSPSGVYRENENVLEQLKNC